MERKATGLTSSSDKTPENDKAFSGYQWTFFSENSRWFPQLGHFLESVNWPALLDCAAAIRFGIDCKLLPDIAIGASHMVRIVEFADGTRWVARLRIGPRDAERVMTLMNCEFNTISVVRQKTGIPVPQIYAMQAKRDCSVNAPFMLMECLEGNVAMDLGMKIPLGYRKAFWSGVAKIHVQLSSVQLPKIGKIVSINEDGTYQQGPIPGLGGPFDTATEFFKAWAAAHPKYPNKKERIIDLFRGRADADEVIPSADSFPKSINDIADRLSVRDHGPFPLCHGDFAHNNIIVDDNYRILGVVHWESAFAGPWELFGVFPVTLGLPPRALGSPGIYDEKGFFREPESVQRLADQKDYIAAVRQEENRSHGNSRYLSEALTDTKRQQVATAMYYFEQGTAGFYSRVIDEFLSGNSTPDVAVRQLESEPPTGA